MDEIEKHIEAEDAMRTVGIAVQTAKEIVNT